MPIFDRASLEQSPLADLHAIASELSIDGYRRLRKPDLIGAILLRQEGEEVAEGNGEDAAPRRRRTRRGGRARERGGAGTDGGPRGEGPAEIEEQLERAGEPSERETEGERADEELVEGVVELLPNGSAFVRVNPPEPSDEDIYVSAAQVKRCELVSGDRVSGPRRAPRRSERFASLVRVDTINGRPASELADSARFEDLPAAFPSQPLARDSDEETIRAVLEVAPIGAGSRVTIAGAPQSGKTELLRRLLSALGGHEDLQVWLVLAGVRPEELTEWRAGTPQPAAAVTLSGSTDAQAQAIEGVVEQARRMASRGARAVVLIDTLEALAPPAARRVLASARQIVDGGSLTVVATRSDPVGGETTVISLDLALARSGRFPALDPEASWTMRRELLTNSAG
jgi:transcription termination factor Rho